MDDVFSLILTEHNFKLPKAAIAQATTTIKNL